MKTTTTLLLWLLLLGQSAALWAQAPTLQWRRQFGIRRTQDVATAMLHSRHNRLVVVGEARGMVGFGSATCWLLSNQGDSLRSTIYFQNAVSASVIQAVAEAPDGDFFMLGTHYTSINGQTISSHFLIRTDSLGTQRWVQHYHAGSYTIVDTNACVALPDGGALLVMTRNDPAGSQQYPIRVPTVMRVDAQGGVVWDRSYGSPYSELHSIVPLPDGSYALAGVEVQRLTNPVRLTSAPWLVRLTLNGNIISTSTFPLPQLNAAAYALRPTADGSLLLVGDAFDPDQPNVPTQGLLLQLDAQDREAWHQLLVSPRQLYNTDNCALYQVWPLPTPGQFVVAGSRFDLTSGTAGYGYLAQFAPAPGGTGAVPTWELQFLKYEDYHRPYDYILRPDHTLTVADYGRTTITQQPDVFVSRFAGLPTVYAPDLCATPPAPNATFSSPPAHPDSLALADFGTPGPAYAQLVHWRWDLGDGTTIEQTTPAWLRHRYAPVPPAGTPVTLTLTNNLGCTAAQTLFPWGGPLATAPAQQLAARATLFPAPAASGQPVTLRLPGLRPQPPVPAELLDALGRPLRRFALPAAAVAAGQALPLGALPPGVYALRLHPAEGSVTKRLVIQ